MFTIRIAKKEDISFVYSTWLKSYKHGSPLTKYTKRELFFEVHQRILDELLSKSKVIIACKDDDEDLIFGYIVFEPHIMHYVYVKEPFRNYGIGKRLIQEVKTPFQTSHLTYSLLDLWTAKKIQCDFNPYLLTYLGALT